MTLNTNNYYGITVCDLSDEEEVKEFVEKYIEAKGDTILFLNAIIQTKLKGKK